jgi:SAM-dependent methyltransferase
MTNKWFTDPDKLKSSQYATEKNLSARINVHEKYSTNPVDYPIWIFDRMLEDFPQDANIIEFGCGNALIWTNNTHRIPDGWTITLTDLSQGMLDDAKQNLGDFAKRFNFQVVDIQDAPFEDNQADAIMANFMLYHVPDRAKAIEELRRVLKSYGVLHSVTLGSNHLLEHLQLVERVVPQYKWNNGDLPFRADNAIKELSTQFKSVTEIPYDDNLCITETEPMVEYLASTARIENITHDELAKYRALVEDIIAENGEFYVQKQVVLFKSEGYAISE